MPRLDTEGFRARRDRAAVPFVVQRGQDLFMLASEGAAWVLAELAFDTERCVFTERRRAHYEWPREAFGALLSRVAPGDTAQAETLERVTTDFSHWLGAHFAETPSA